MRELSLILALLIGTAAVSTAARGADRAAAGAAQAALPPKASRASAGQPAPAGGFVDAAGKAETLAAYKGRPVLVNLWATWCAPCIAEMPALDRLQARVGGKLVVLPVSQDLGGWRAVNRFATPGKFKVLSFRLDKENNLALAYKAQGLPVTVLYDAAGREVWRVNGPVEWDKLPLSAFGL